MYIWQWQFADDYTVIGRTWDDFIYLKDRIDRAVGDDYIVVFVHNLSFEYQFLAGILNFGIDDVFCIDNRKVLKASAGRLEFRCSYLHSNMSLYEYTKKMGARHVKLSGTDFDYSKKRYPWTELSADELQYTINDVLGLVEAITNEMLHDDDNLYTFPLTSTGYVRRDAKKAMRSVGRHWLMDQVPDLTVYKMLRAAFRGGNTHANRYFSERILINVKSWDRSSSYPDVQLNDEIPVSGFYHFGPARQADIDRKMIKEHKALLMHIAIHDLRLTCEHWGFPYLSTDKCEKIQNADIDNGRILSCDYLETVITDVDLRIIQQEYSWSDIVYADVYTARYGRHPEALRACTVAYYRAKTELKNVDGQEVFYLKNKNKLNSIYGMEAQNQLKESTVFFDGTYYTGKELNDLLTERAAAGEEIPEYHYKDENERLDEYKKKGFLMMQWGVWITAWARYRLEEGLRLVTRAGGYPIYCDTDSVKYIDNGHEKEIAAAWEKYNAARMAASKESGAYATDPAGVTHYMGVYEQEDTYAYFATRGAKKYAYIYGSGKHAGELGVTIAGVNKQAAPAELIRGKAAGRTGDILKYRDGIAYTVSKDGTECKIGAAMDGLQRFLTDFTFYDAGGTESVYNDTDNMIVNVDGRTLPITRNVVIRDSTYTLGVTPEYERLLERCADIFGIDKYA